MWAGSEALPWRLGGPVFGGSVFGGSCLASVHEESTASPRDDAATPARPGHDAERVEALYLRLEAPLTNTLYRWLWSREDVRDVMQEAFVRLWQMRERVDWDRAVPLVYRIALNLASKRRRSRRLWRWIAFEPAHEPAAPDGTTERERHERARAVQRAIEDLPERLRRVLVLSLHAELDHAQIAETLGIAVGTVASRRSAAVERLRRALERAGHGAKGSP